MSEEKIRRPRTTAGLKAVDQLGILVLDGSGSMGEPDAKGRGTKAEAVGVAVKELISVLQKSTRSQDFSLSLIIFDDQVEASRLAPTPVKDINLDALNTNPYLGGKTAIGDALEKAGEIAGEFLNQGGELPRKVVVMLMSDGANCAGKDPLSVSEELKNKLGDKKGTICCVSYGEAADQETLKKISSDPEKNFKDTDDPVELRTFFEASMVAVD